MNGTGDGVTCRTVEPMSEVKWWTVAPEGFGIRWRREPMQRLTQDSPLNQTQILKWKEVLQDLKLMLQRNSKYRVIQCQCSRSTEAWRLPPTQTTRKVRRKMI